MDYSRCIQIDSHFISNRAIVKERDTHHCVTCLFSSASKQRHNSKVDDLICSVYWLILLNLPPETALPNDHRIQPTRNTIYILVKCQICRINMCLNVDEVGLFAQWFEHGNKLGYIETTELS